jgi:hypothetical protein
MFAYTSRLYTLVLSLTLTVGGMGCTPKLVGPTASSGYFFSFDIPFSVLRNERAELVVHVQDAQGNPIDGIPVEFQVEPAWVQSASVFPSRVVTTGGRARTIFRVSLIGVVHVIARVDNTTQEKAIAILHRGDTSGDS